MTEKAIVVLSGGQDSTTCLYWALERGYVVRAVTFDYGQRHRRELVSAQLIAAYASVSVEIIRITDILKGSSPLVSDKPLDEYENHDSLPGGLEKTFVPMRNQLFLTIAANRAYVNGCSTLITGVSAEDYGGYPDCRPEFISSFELTSSLGTFTGQDGTPTGLRVRTPLMHLNKAQTAALSLHLGHAYEALALSHTSYAGEYPPSSKDHASLLRAKGFELAGIPDPLVLRAWLENKMDLPRTANYGAVVIDRYVNRVRKVISWLSNNRHVLADIIGVDPLTMDPTKSGSTEWTKIV